MKTLLYKACLFVIFIVCSFSVTAQSDSLKIDSLKKVLSAEKEDTNKVNTLNALCVVFFNIGDNKNALEKAQSAFILSEKLNYLNGKGASLLNIGTYYEYVGEQPEARKNYNKAIEYYIAAGNKNGAASAHISIVSSYNQEGDGPHALENIYKALNIFEETGDKYGLAGTYLMLGNNFNVENNYEQALKNLFLGLEISEKLGDKESIAVANSLIAEVYFKQGNYDEALKRDSFALKFYDTLVPNLNIATILKNIGNIYEILGRIANVKGDINNSKTKYARALEKYFSAITIYKEKNVEGFVYGTYTDVGKVYMQLNNLSKARIYLEESRSFFEKQIDHGALEIVYKSLSDLDSASGDFPQAYKDYKKSIEHHDSTYVEESAKKTQQITMQYQFDKKEAISKAEQGRKDAETKRTRQTV